MNRTQHQAVLLSLIQQLRENGSWCGETHIQKSAYFLQEMLGVPLGLNVIFCGWSITSPYTSGMPASHIRRFT
jgi:hypothetical protein